MNGAGLESLPDRVDVAIVGSGMGGSILAQMLRKTGKSVLLIERSSHPRFAIGESTSPLMNLLLEEIAHRYDLPRLLPLTTWGSWKRTYPELGVGKKRGFSYYGHQPHESFTRRPDRADQLLVAASPADPCADTHWLRADVDTWLADEAKALGVHYVDQTAISALETIDREWQVTLSRKGDVSTLRAGMLIDAGGPNGVLHRYFGGRDLGFSGYPPTRSIYTHFRGVKPIDELREFDASSDTPPYPPDRAAVHHVFPGGWMWVLRFDNGIVSAGVAAENAVADRLGFGPGGAGWENFLAEFPSVGPQFTDAEPVEPWVYAPKLTFRAERAAGLAHGAPWALLPSAAGFVDPFYSTGMTLTLIGAGRLGRLAEQNRLDDPDALADYETDTFSDLDWTAEFVACHYASFKSFPHFAALTMYYFAAASYSEMARRLNRPAPRFLCGDDPVFRAGIARCRSELSSAATPDPDEFAARIRADIAHKNIAGLADPKKRNWYGVDLDDVVRSASRLGFSPDTMRKILADASWTKCE